MAIGGRWTDRARNAIRACENDAIKDGSSLPGMNSSTRRPLEFLRGRCDERPPIAIGRSRARSILRSIVLAILLAIDGPRDLHENHRSAEARWRCRRAAPAAVGDLGRAGFGAGAGGVDLSGSSDGGGACR